MEKIANPLFSIGYGNRAIDDFFKVLHLYKINLLIDVRSSPYSKYKIEFNKQRLESYAKTSSVNYVFMGNLLGGLPGDENNYSGGKVNYTILRNRDKFKQGLDQLIKFNKGDTKISIMCSEAKPENCHRSKLIGRELKKRGVDILHIDENDIIKTQDTVMNIVTNGLGENDLFGEKPLSSNKKYYPK